MSSHDALPRWTASSQAEVYAAQECRTEPNQAADSVRLVVMDPITGRIGRRVATVEGVGSVTSLSVSRDGSHFLLAASDFGIDSNDRIDDGRVSQLPTNLQRLVW